MRRGRRILPLLLAVAAACGSGNSGSGASVSTAPAPTSDTPTTAATQSTQTGGTTGSAAPDVSTVTAKLVRVAAGLDEPVAFASRPRDTGLYVAEQHVARVRVVRNGVLAPAPVLDLHGAVAQDNEQGLLGLAFSPDGTKLYVDLITPANDTNVDEYAMRGDVADPATKRVVLTVHQPYPNHKGGQIAFGNDGMLYIGLGDGGSEGDPQNNGQNRRTLLSKILRINPAPVGSHPYSIPSDNPFLHNANAAPETWVWGLRNPWRFSFDSATHDLWIGDVGGGSWEEVDHLPAGRGGQNLGWSLREGAHALKGSRPPGEVDPVFEYSHSGGRCAIIGGFVYRGHAIANLVGSYVYADNCDGEINALDAQNHPHDLHASVSAPESFGTDNAGELYVLSGDGGVYRIAAG